MLQGDWGTQFGMLIQHIAETRPGGLHGTTTEDVSDLQALYKASKQRFDAEEDFKARAREAVTRLQSGDPEFEEVSSVVLTLYVAVSQQPALQRTVVPPCFSPGDCTGIEEMLYNAPLWMMLTPVLGCVPDMETDLRGEPE